MTPAASVEGPSERARWLGYAGLLPFVGGALAAFIPPAAPLAPAVLATYAAVILSFLGGIHWGLGMLRGRPLAFAWGVIPSLIAWPALWLPNPAGLLVLAAALVLCLAVDRQTYPGYGLAAWLPLRLQLTLVAAASCALAALAS
jgi:hypothetical protein